MAKQIDTLITESTLLDLLELRFEKNSHRHPNVLWTDIKLGLENNSKLLKVVLKMENSGGEPDVILFKEDKTLAFADCSKESPSGRRSLCFDQKALLSRKDFPPTGDAVSMAKEIGIDLLSEQQYYYLQSLEDFDLKTSSWIATSEEFRKLGGALFCEKRYKQTFTFHNGAQSYYAARGFRGLIKL